MERYKAIAAYDGTHFNGFQRQSNELGIRTVQGVIETALRNLNWSGKSILFAGRTDTGVHSCGQIFSFDLAWSHSINALTAAINAYLPPDVAVRKVETTAKDFHPRFDAVARRYRYRIYCDIVSDPLKDRYAWRVWPRVDINRLKQAACLLVGTQNFSGFGSSPIKGNSTIRKVYRAEWFIDNDDMIFEIIANSFLYHMVRRIVSYQVPIGQRRISIKSLEKNLDIVTSEMVQGLAPPSGLTLVEVFY